VEEAQNKTESHLPSWLQGIAHNITDSISDDINDAIGSIAKRVGVEDFYSAHMLDYCYGTYTPQPVPNDTVHANDIHRNVTACSNATAMYNFDPAQALQDSLNRSGVDITLSDLQWPQQIQDALNALRIAAKAAFVLYCIGIAVAFCAFITSILGIFSSGRLVAFVNVLTSIVAFLALGIASALVTAIMVKGSNAINKYGREIGVEANRGNNFLAITWAATGAMLLAIIIWSLECCVGHRRRPRTYADKPAMSERI
jgi:hypothetical protein